MFLSQTPQKFKNFNTLRKSRQQGGGVWILNGMDLSFSGLHNQKQSSDSLKHLGIRNIDNVSLLNLLKFLYKVVWQFTVENRHCEV